MTNETHAQLTARLARFSANAATGKRAALKAELKAAYRAIRLANRVSEIESRFMFGQRQGYFSYEMATAARKMYLARELKFVGSLTYRGYMTKTALNQYSEFGKFALPSSLIKELDGRNALITGNPHRIDFKEIIALRRAARLARFSANAQALTLDARQQAESVFIPFGMSCTAETATAMGLTVPEFREMHIKRMVAQEHLLGVHIVVYRGLDGRYFALSENTYSAGRRVFVFADKPAYLSWDERRREGENKPE